MSGQPRGNATQRLAALILALLAQATVPADPEIDLATGLDEVAALLDGSRTAAAARLDELLARHGTERYALLYRPRIAELARTARFLEAYAVPTPQELSSGELLDYQPTSGRVRVRYRPDALDDFVELKTPWTTYLTHPAQFKRGYTITLRGTDCVPRKAEDTLVVLCDYGPGTVNVLEIGGGRLPRASVVHYGPEGVSVLDVQPVPRVESERFELEVRVGNNEVAARLNGKRLVRAKKESRDLGAFGLAGLRSGIEEVEVAGTIQASWMRGLEDAHFHAALEEADVAVELPEPLRVEPAPAAAFETLLMEQQPGPERPGQGLLLSTAIERFVRESPADAFAYVEKLDEAVITDELRIYIGVILRWRDGSLEEARDACARLLEAVPDFSFGRLLLARLQVQIDGPEAAPRAAAELVEQAPDDERCCAIAAELLLFSRRPEEAEAVLRAGIERGLYGPWMDRVNALRLESKHGPPFVRRFEHETKHYRIVSDIDERACEEAARVLEIAVEHYASQMLPLPRDTGERSIVYLFAGEAGYLAYIRDATENTPENSAGVYFPGLRQLLIWNSPDRAEMLRTVRHEGLHQYVDRLTGGAPIWLQEGLAEYWEEADFTKGRSDQDVPTPLRLRMVRLLRPRFVPWNELLDVPPGRFQADPALHYEQSWAFVHFLMNDGSDTRNRLRGLLADLAAGRGTRAAQQAAFGDLDRGELQRRFDAYVTALLGSR